MQRSSLISFRCPFSGPDGQIPGVLSFLETQPISFAGYITHSLGVFTLQGVRWCHQLFFFFTVLSATKVSSKRTHCVKLGRQVLDLVWSLPHTIRPLVVCSHGTLFFLSESSILCNCPDLSPAWTTNLLKVGTVCLGLCCQPFAVSGTQYVLKDLLLE